MTSARNHQIATRCRGVTKHFGAGETLVRALRGVDLDVHCGELTLLEGPSGCGKTTLLSVMSGLYRPTDGDVEVFEQSLNDLSDAELVAMRRRSVGFVFQQFNLLPALTAAENAAVPSIIGGEKRNEAIGKACELLDIMNMGHRCHALPDKLSGGEKQRVAIARAVVHRPDLVLCDEPTASLDAKSGKLIMELLGELALEERRAVLVVTHDPRVFDYADKIASMDDGQISQVHNGSGHATTRSSAEAPTE